MSEFRNIYIAGKTSDELVSIEDFSHELEVRGHSITYKWWEQACAKPYLAPENYDISQQLATEMENGILKSDTFILLAHSAILGAGVEFGMAIGDKQPRDIYVILGQARQSIFYAYPDVTILKDKRQIQEINWY